MENENINGTDPVKKNGTGPQNNGQKARGLSLSEQVRMISGGPYSSSMSTRAASSHSDDFDPNSRLSSLNNKSEQSGEENEDGVKMNAGNVDVYDDRFTIRRANVRSVSAVKKNQPKPTAGVKKKAKKRTVTKRRLGAGKIIFRVLVCILAAVIIAAVSAFGLVYVIAHGPSTAARNALVLNSKQFDATKWIPEFVLGKDVVDEIVGNSLKPRTEQMDIAEYTAKSGGDADIWADAKDGMLFETVRGRDYNAYILRVKDASRLFVAVSGNDYANGMTVFDCAEKYGCIAAVNGGEFSGAGPQPAGLTYSQGAPVFDDGISGYTLIGFNALNVLTVKEGMTGDEAAALGIRDAVCSGAGSVLIDSADGKVNIRYYDDDIGALQRTAIGQCSDGSVILIVTDGDPKNAAGAVKNDITDMMTERGAITAALLKSGTSSVMYYRGYAEKYDIDTSTLDENQKNGTVNKTGPSGGLRYIPTYFAVKEEATVNEG